MPAAPPAPCPAPTWDAVCEHVRAAGLRAVGGLRPEADDAVPPGTATLVLLAPRDGAFWPRFTAAPEAADGRPDPLDRYSRRVIGRIACTLGAKALFPFTGPPWHPFTAWARRTGRLHVSPVGLLVEAEAGLWLSLRGALALRTALEPPPPVAAPCATCAERPCTTACPVGALAPGAPYDVAACHGWLDQPGADCLGAGCAARRACPASQGWSRAPAQSAFHMRAFHGHT